MVPTPGSWTCAAREVDSSFIRRQKIPALIGLPLLVTGHLVGLLFLN
jgi:hypothetical protein